MPQPREHGRSRKLRWRHQSGLVLTELLVAAAVSVITLTAVLSALELVVRHQPRINQRGDRIQEARTVFERMTKELRQTYSVNDATSSTLDVLTYRRPVGGGPAAQLNVFYSCSGDTCMRQEGPVGGPLGTAEEMFTGIDNADIFTYQPSNLNPTYVRIKVRFNVNANSVDPQKPVTLLGGVQLRNTLSSGGGE